MAKGNCPVHQIKLEDLRKIPRMALKMLDQNHENNNWTVGCDQCDREEVFDTPQSARDEGWSILLYGSIPAVVCPKDIAQ